MYDQVSEQILQALVTKSMLPQAKAQEVAEQMTKQETTLEKLLVEAHILEEEQLAQVKAETLGLTYVDLRELTIPRETLQIIPESTARGHSIIAYEQAADKLKVAMADPNDRQIVEFIHKKVDIPVEIALASATSIRDSLAHYQESLENEFSALVEEAKGVAAESDLNKVAEDLPTIRIVDAVLKHAILQNASDVHIEPTEREVIIRYRIDGILHDALILPRHVLAGLVARIKVLSNLKIDEHRLPQDGRFKIETSDYNVAFRVSTLPVFDGEKVVMRLLDESGRGLSLDDIGMSARTLEIFRRNIQKPHGMILVTGPTGSGKTTTLYAAMRELNTADVNISTIEDPIEYRMPRINQTQVQPAIGLTFSNGLRSLVRQDPDIIMVGEIRDEETASLAVNAALTGHLVLSTLHTNSAAGALPRLLDMAVEAFLVSSTMNVLLAQRLVRKLCLKCRRESKLTPTMLESLKHVIDTARMLDVLTREGGVEKGIDWKDLKIFQAVGCTKCREGYKGRVGLYEALEMTPEIQKIITAKTTSQQLEDEAKAQQSMVTMLEDGMIKVVQGLTTIEEVLRVAKE